MRASEESPLPAKGFGSGHGTGYGPMKRSTPFTRHNKSHIWNEGFNIFWPEIQFPGRLEQVTSIFFPGEPGKPGTCSEHGQLFRYTILPKSRGQERGLLITAISNFCVKSIKAECRGTIIGLGEGSRAKFNQDKGVPLRKLRLQNESM